MSNSGGNLTVQYNLRWSEDMRDKIAAVAKENTRSMNQEIIARLEQSFQPAHIDTVSDKIINDLLEGTVSKLLESMRDQGIDQSTINKTLVGAINKKAP